MDPKFASLGFVFALIVVFLIYMLITNRRMIKSGEYSALNKKAQEEKEIWSFKKRRTTTVKRAAK